LRNVGSFVVADVELEPFEGLGRGVKTDGSGAGAPADDSCRGSVGLSTGFDPESSLTRLG
jgi:hypothetical protein